MAYSNKTHKLAPDGKTAYVKNSDGSVSLWKNGKFVKKYNANSSQAKNIYKNWNNYGDYTRTNLNTRAKQNSSGSSSNSNNGGSSSSAGEGDTSTDTSSTDTSTDSTSSNGHYTTTVEEVEIDNYYEALRFAYKYAHMILRENGHSIELKVIGGPEWRIGEWCKVNIPTFNEKGTMFITKCSTELGASDENIASLTLVDYPPSLSSGTSNTADTNTTSTSSEDTSTVTNEDGSTTTTNTDGTSTTTYSDGSSVSYDSSGNATSVNGSTSSQAAKSIKLGKNKKLVTAAQRKDGERYLPVITNGKVSGYLHLSKSEVSTVLKGSGQTKMPVRSSVSKMKKGERYKRVYKNGKLIKLIWVKKDYKGPMHIYL